MIADVQGHMRGTPIVTRPSPLRLQATVVYSGQHATIVSRCYVGGEWLFGLRLRNGELVHYVPERLVA